MFTHNSYSIVIITMSTEIIIEYSIGTPLPKIPILIKKHSLPRVLFKLTIDIF